jgi:hypothetical protein
MDLDETVWEVWTGFIWLRIWIGNGFYEWGNEPSVPPEDGDFLVAEQLSASQEGLCSIKFV